MLVYFLQEVKEPIAFQLDALLWLVLTLLQHPPQSRFILSLFTLQSLLAGGFLLRKPLQPG